MVGRLHVALIFILIQILVTTLSSTLCSGCYLYPKDAADPCANKKCSFHSTCVVGMDGVTPECLCPEKCARYGDSRGSKSVCGTDGVDYALVCELKRAACNKMKDIQIKYRGLCGKYSYFFSNSLP